MWKGILFISSILLLIDFLSFKGIRRVSLPFILKNYAPVIPYFHWGVSVFTLIFIIIKYFLNKNSAEPDYIQFRGYFIITNVLIVVYLPRLILASFYLVESILLIIYSAIIHIFISVTNKYKRKKALEKFKAISVLGLVASIIVFFLTIHGIFWGRENFVVNEVVIRSPSLPKSFDGIRIAQISDAHLGSFYDKEAIEKGLDKLMGTNADVVFFTGDMINSEAKEAFIYIDLFKKIKAPYGKFAILGNHDMSDYRRWYTQDSKEQEIAKLVEYESQMGFSVLNNQNSYIKRGNDSIAIVGIKNWGLPPFHAYGDLNEALKGVPNNIFTILMSHDPTHWSEQVKNKTKIQLTLAGHTHAMQMGISLWGWEWSPGKYKYPLWSGLFQNEIKDQYLYVNKGFGYIGFAGRIGMWPEITVITLKSK